MTDGALVQTLDETLRQSDPDRWAASRFVEDEQLRDEVIALSLLGHELNLVRRRITEPLMGEIRLTWWRESLETIVDGGPPAREPILHALEHAHRRLPFDIAPLLAAIDARLDHDFSNETFSPDDALAYAQAADGGLLSCACARLGAPDADIDAIATVAGLRRLIAEGRAETPPSRAQIAEARRQAQALPVAAFPAVAHLAAGAGPATGTFWRSVRILAAVMTGRLF